MYFFFTLIFFLLVTSFLKGYAFLFTFYNDLKSSFQNWKLRYFEASIFLHLIIMVWLFFGFLPTESSIIVFFWAFLIILAFLVIFFSGLKLFLKYLGFWTLETFIRIFIFFNVLAPLFLTFYIEIFYGIFLLFFSAFLLRISWGSVIALLYLFFISLVCLATPLNQEINFNDVFKKYLPFVLFCLLLISLSYLLARINLQYSVLLPIIYNYQIIIFYYKNTWTPRILHSSLIWNLFRLCTPVPIFLFGLEEIIALNGLFGITFVAGLEKGALSYARYKTLAPLADWTKPVLQTRQFVQSWMIEQAPSDVASLENFVQTKVKWLAAEFAKTKKEGYPSLALDDELKKIKKEVLPNWNEFLTLNSKFYDSRELFQYLANLNLLIKEDQMLIPASEMWPKEQLSILKPITTDNFSNLTVLLNFFFEKHAVKSPFIFFFKGTWYLALAENVLFKFDSKAAINSLTLKMAQKELFVHNFPGVGSKVAQISTQDFLIFNYKTLELQATISAKSSLQYNTLEDNSADYLSILNVNYDEIQLFDKNKKIISSKKVAELTQEFAKDEVKAHILLQLERCNNCLTDSKTKAKMTFKAAEALLINKELKVPKAKVTELSLFEGKKIKKNDE